MLRKIENYDIKYNSICNLIWRNFKMSTNLSKIKRDKMLETISKIKENIDDVKQINIIITNLRYQFVSSEYKTLGNTDLEFILDFNL